MKFSLSVWWWQTIIYSQGDASTGNAEIRFKMGSNAWRDVKMVIFIVCLVVADKRCALQYIVKGMLLLGMQRLGLKWAAMHGEA